MIKLFKYSIIEIYQNKFYMFILFIISLITIVTFYVMLSTLTLNLKNSVIPKEFKENAIVSMVNLRPENYEETSPEIYDGFFSDLLKSSYTESIFQFGINEFISTNDLNISTGDESGFNLNDNLDLWGIDGVISSSNYLKEQNLIVDFMKNEGFETFNGNKVLLPRSYEEFYSLGDTIEFYTPYYNNKTENIVEAHPYKVVGYIDGGSKMFNPQTLETFDASQKIIFPEVKFSEISSKNIEYDALYQNLIMSTYYYIDEANITSLTKEINSISNDNNIVINLHNNTSALKLRSNSYKETFKNNLKASIPTIILFIIGISYLISNILEKRIKYISILAMIGAKRMFINWIYIISSSAIIISSNFVFIYIYNKLNIGVINNNIMILNLVIILIIAIVVIQKKLSIVNTSNIRKILKEKND